MYRAFIAHMRIGDNQVARTSFKKLAMGMHRGLGLTISIDIKAMPSFTSLFREPATCVNFFFGPLVSTRFS